MKWYVRKLRPPRETKLALKGRLSAKISAELGPTRFDGVSCRASIFKTESLKHIKLWDLYQNCLANLLIYD